MNEYHDQMEMKPELAAILRMLIAFGVGLLLGALGDKFAWNRLENPWPYLGLLCPLLLGMSVALTVGIRNRHSWLSTLGASSLAWIGFYLTFVVIAFQMHPYQVINPSQPDPSQSDPLCSPCFSSDLFTGIFIVYFFPVGLFFVVLIAFATSRGVKFVRRICNKPESGS